MSYGMRVMVRGWEGEVRQYLQDLSVAVQGVGGQEAQFLAAGCRRYEQL